VLLSEFEGLPVALVESMARGCVPVAAEMESGTPEIVRSGENGLVVQGT
jgi:glycosyltransferase involved in cell wall biosynthesis